MFPSRQHPMRARTLIWPVAALLIACWAAPAVHADAPQRTGIIYEKTFEAPNDNMNGFYTYCDADKMVVVNEIRPVTAYGHDQSGYRDTVRSGSGAAYFWLNAVDSEYDYRTMAHITESDDAPWGSRPGAHSLDYGETYWIGLSMYIPDYYEADAQGELWFQGQGHNAPDGTEKIDWAMYTDETRRGRSTPSEPVLRIENRRSGKTTYFPMVKGWADWVIEFKPHASSGVLRVWRNGDLIHDESGVRTSYSSSGASYFTFGVYKYYWNDGDSSGLSSLEAEAASPHYDVWYDEIRIGNSSASYSDVAPGGEAVAPLVPTAEPTAQPTAEPPAPTPQPTAEPPAPTPQPTAEPTALPTPQPTDDPTAAPTPQPTQVPSAAGEIIIDDTDAGFTTVSSDDAWVNGTTAPDQFGQSHVYNRTVGSGQDVARWEFALAEPGQYQVYAWWSASPNRPSDAPYTVHHAEGTTPVTMDQTVNGGRWNLLGTFTFDGQGAVTVTDAASTGRNLVADALRLVAVARPGAAAADPGTLTESAYLP